MFRFIDIRKTEKHFHSRDEINIEAYNKTWVTSAYDFYSHVFEIY